MTYPIRNALDLSDALLQFLGKKNVAVEAELRDGSRWQLDGMKTDVDGETVTRFVLCVGPKEEK